MANRKMIPAGLAAPVPRRKNPPPPGMVMELLKSLTIFNLNWSVVVLEDGIVLRFEEEAQFIGMSAAGARQLAAELVKRAEELEARGK